MDLTPITNLAEAPLRAACLAISHKCRYSNESSMEIRSQPCAKLFYCEANIQQILPRDEKPSLEWGNGIYEELRKLKTYPGLGDSFNVSFNFPRGKWREDRFDTHHTYAGGGTYSDSPRGWELLPNFDGLEATLRYSVTRPEDISLQVAITLNWKINPQ